MKKYLLWSPRANGWLTSGGNYASNISDAEVVDYESAIFRCQIHYQSGEYEFGLVPVPRDLLDVIRSVTK